MNIQSAIRRECSRSFRRILSTSPDLGRTHEQGSKDSASEGFAGRYFAAGKLFTRQRIQ